MSKCRVCGSFSRKIFNCLVLTKHDVDYFQCESCNFIQTESPYWLDEAYSSAITSLDIGLTSRNVLNAPLLETLIKTFYSSTGQFLDYGGGYGMLVRMMRDKGFNFYRQDMYCENIFSKHFDVDNLIELNHSFELVTAFEVFEHLVEPVNELNIMLEYSSDIFFSTTLYPKDTDLQKWWYLIPETGQHIALYSIKTLQFMASKSSLNYYHHGDYHLFTKKKLSQSSFERVFNHWYRKILNRIRQSPSSLLNSDFNKISSIKM